VSILPFWLLYKVIQLTGHDTFVLVAKGPSLLYALCFAGPTDWTVARLASSLSCSTPTTTTTAGLWALFFSITSWFHGYCLVRTYTNSIECFLITLITALLLLPKPKDLHNNYHNNRNALAFFLMGITVAGVRFTSLAAFLPLLALPLAQGIFPARWVDCQVVTEVWKIMTEKSCLDSLGSSRHCIKKYRRETYQSDIFLCRLKTGHI
jgi:hypothetical protein